MKKVMFSETQLCKEIFLAGQVVSAGKMLIRKPIGVRESLVVSICSVNILMAFIAF